MFFFNVDWTFTGLQRYIPEDRTVQRLLFAEPPADKLVSPSTSACALFNIA
jgi:hypothetical protein